MHEYLHSTEVIDWRHPAIVEQARRLVAGSAVDTARRCFEFVRDEIRHSGDFQLNPVTCRASDVLMHRTGFCYAKSHLLAALLRASGTPAGLCYQRLCVTDDSASIMRYCLHGLTAVWLPECGWYRVDPRGAKPGVEAEFTPPEERLAFAANRPGEADVPGVWAEPLPQVVSSLERHSTWEQLADDLPDLDPAAFLSCAANHPEARRAVVRVAIPYHLRMLANVQGELQLEVAEPVTQRSVLDALEARFPVLRGTIRDHATQRRRAFLRLYACEQDLSNEAPDTPLPPAVAAGEQPYIVVSAIAGG